MADSPDHSFECDVCCEPFDLAARRPKLLSCGHTVCLACVGGILDKSTGAPGTFPCPKDRKETRGRPDELKDNYYIMSLIQGTPKPEKPRGASAARSGQPNFWCVECKAVADAVCVDKHTIRRLHKERSKQMKATLDLLERAVGTQRRLAQRLEDVEAAVKELVQRQLAETRAAAARNQELLTRLYDSLDLVGPEWDDVQRAAEQAHRSSEKTLALDEQSLQLLAATGKCEVAVPAPAGAFQTVRGGGGAWRADVDLAADGVAAVRGLLVHLQRAGMLRQEQEPEETAPEPAAPALKPAATAPQPPAPQRIDKLEVLHLSQSGPGQRQEEKAATLARVRRQGVRRMVDVWCDEDPARALDLLQSAAPTLEELHVRWPREEHLRAVHAMPRLQRLELFCHDALHAQPPVLAALPQASLKWLRVFNLPRPSLESLLQAHSATLDVLWLWVGTTGGKPFPEHCNDLDALLGQCGLRVTRVVLSRSCRHDRAACTAQVSAVRRVLPGATVQCHECDGVAWEDF